MAVRINVAGLGDVAGIAHWPQTKLKSVAQGTSSIGQIVIRDFGFTPTDFITGKRIEVDLGPGTDNIWGGYLMRANRRFWFPVDDPDKLHRQWILTVVDNNILFNKRIVFSPSTPALVEGPHYTADTYDDVVLADLFDWLDLSADGIDTTTRVNRVAYANVGQPYYPINGGMRWGQVMEIISWLPNAVWYLDPNWRLVYADVDDEDAPLELSDHPGSGQAGYREAIIMNDGAQLANDIAGWGFGKGANHGVFKRQIDSASVAAHGLWQDSFVDYGVWKQATIDRVVDSAINGSPSSKRGRKNDRFEVNLVTHEHGFRVGQRPRFINELWGVDDVIPIREMEISFESPTSVNYAMKLTHEIDKRWTMFDPLPPIKIPKIKDGPEPKVKVPHIDDTHKRCHPVVCGLIDGFGRTVPSGGWGTSDYGTDWDTISLYTGASASVDGSRAVAQMVNVSAIDTRVEMGLAYASDGSEDMTFVFQMDFSGTLNSSGTIAVIKPDDTAGYAVSFFYGLVSGVPTQQWRVSDTGGSHVLGTLGVDAFQPCNVRIQASPTVWNVKVWQVGDPEPTAWSFESTTFFISTYDGGLFNIQCDNLCIGTYTVYLSDLAGEDRCSATQFDTFTRTVSANPGVATPSKIPWLKHTGPGGTDYGVNGSQLFCGMSGGSFTSKTERGYGRWIDHDVITFDTRFYFYQDAGVHLNFESIRMELADDSGNSAGWVFQINGTGGGLIVYSEPSAGVQLYTLPSAWSSIDYSGDPVWFRAKWQTILSTGDVSMKVWLETDGEPSTWTVILPAGYIQPLVQAETRFYVELSSSFANRAGYVDYIDWDYIGIDGGPTDGSSSVSIHDELNRTTSSGWGTVAASFSPGNTFPTWDTAGSNVYTDGNEGVLHATRPSQPIIDSNLDYGVRLLSQDMLVVFRTSRAPVGNDFIAIYCGTGAPALVIKVGSASLSTGVGTSPMSHSIDLTAGVRVRLDTSGGLFTAAIWQDGDPEPSPQMAASFTNADELTRATIQASIQVGSADLDVFVDDFYVEGSTVASQSGRPCYVDCGNPTTVIATFDNFNRTDNSNPPQMGATPSGYVWHSFGSPIGTLSYEGLNGSSWFQKMGHNFNNTAPGKNDGTDLWAPSVWSMRVRFRMTDSAPTSNNRATLIVGPYSSSMIAVTIDERAWNGSVGGTLQIGGSAYSLPGTSGRIFNKNDWAADVWYIMEYLYDHDNGREKARVYVDGSTPPAYQLDVSGASVLRGITGSSSDFGFLLNTDGSHATSQVQVDSIEFETDICTEILPVPVAVSGEVIEDHTVNVNWVVVGAPFVPGSTTVWVDGILQTSYLEQPTIGKITLGFEVDGPTRIKIRYTVA